MANLAESIRALNENVDLNESWQSLEARMKPMKAEIKKIDDMLDGLRQKLTEDNWKEIESAYDKAMIVKHIKGASQGLVKLHKRFH